MISTLNANAADKYNGKSNVRWSFSNFPYVLCRPNVLKYKKKSNGTFGRISREIDCDEFIRRIALRIRLKWKLFLFAALYDDWLSGGIKLSNRIQRATGEDMKRDYWWYQSGMQRKRGRYIERERKKCIAGYNLIIIWEFHVFGIRLTIFTQAQRARSCAHIKYSLTTIEIGTFL